MLLWCGKTPENRPGGPAAAPLKSRRGVKVSRYQARPATRFFDQLAFGLVGICAMLTKVLAETPDAVQELVPGVHAAADGAVWTMV